VTDAKATFNYIIDEDGGCPVTMEIDGTRQRGPDGIVSEGMWRVLACPMKMLRIRISGGRESRGTS